MAGSTTVEHTPVSGRGASQLSPFCVPILDCVDGVNRHKGTLEKRTTTFPAGSVLVGAPFTETVETCCGVTGKLNRFVVTKQRVQLGSGTVGVPNCVMPGEFDCCQFLMPCCTPAQKIPATLTLKFNPGYNGYRAAWNTSGGGGFGGGLTSQRPTFLQSGGAHSAYQTITDCSVLSGVQIPLDYNGTFYNTRPNTFCTQYIDSGGTLRSIEANRFRIWTGSFVHPYPGGPTYTAALDVHARLEPCFGGGAGKWVLFVEIYMVLTRAPFGDCDIDGVVIPTLQNNDGDTSVPFGALGYPPGDFFWNWHWSAADLTVLPHVYCRITQDDPCALARPIHLYFSQPCPDYCAFWGGSCTAFSVTSVPDGAVTVFPSDYHGFSIDQNAAPFASWMIQNCSGASSFIEVPNSVPPFYSDPDKTGQVWSFVPEIFE
jgi:hypothetical protein